MGIEQIELRQESRRRAPAPRNKGAKRSRRAGVIAGLIVLLLLVIAGILPRWRRQGELARAAEEKRNEVPTVQVIAPRQPAETSELTLPGATQAIQEAVVSARANGFVKRWLADIGARVREGQLLAEIDTPEVDQQLRQAQQESLEADQQLNQSRQELAQAQAALQQAQAGLKQAQTQSELARIELDRSNNLVGKGVVSRQETDQMQAAFNVRKADVDSALANVQLRQANVRAMEASIDARRSGLQARQANTQRIAELLSFRRVVAPFSGVITARNIDVGSLIQSGTPTGAAANGTSNAGGASGGGLFRIARNDVIRVFVNAPQTYAAAIRAGLKAEAQVRELPQQSFTGEVIHTANALDQATRTLLTEVQVPNPTGQILPGMYAQVKFALAPATRALIIPASALIVRAEGQFVAVVRDGKAHFRKVEVGRDFGQEIEVVSGLGEDEAVVITPSDALTEGGLVKAIKVERKKL
jgi:multidrug efflux pump subunit AcrA (membrane-fusion protein)